MQALILLQSAKVVTVTEFTKGFLAKTLIYGSISVFHSLNLLEIYINPIFKINI